MKGGLMIFKIGSIFFHKSKICYATCFLWKTGARWGWKVLLLSVITSPCVTLGHSQSETQDIIVAMTTLSVEDLGAMRLEGTSSISDHIPMCDTGTFPIWNTGYYSSHDNIICARLGRDETGRYFIYQWSHPHVLHWDIPNLKHRIL